MNEENNQVHLDFLSLLKQSKEMLSEKSLDTFISLDKSSLSNLLSGRRLLLNVSFKDWFAPVFVEDKNNHLFYPFFFLKTKTRREKNGVFLSKEDFLPVFNSVALNFLGSLGLDVSDFSRINDLNSYLLSFSSAIEVAKVSSLTGLCSSLAFYDEEKLMNNAPFELALSSLNSSPIDKKFQGMFFDSNNQMTKGNNGKEYFFSDYRKALEVLESPLSSVKVICQNETIVSDFTRFAITNILPRSETILLVVNDEKEKKKCLSVLSKKELSAFSIDGTEITPTGFEDYFRERHYFPLTLDERKRFWNFRENTSKYVSFYRKKEECFDYPNMNIDADIINILLDGKEGNHLALDITDYSEADYKSDVSFIKSLITLSSVRDSYISDHLFFGLSVSGKKDNYDALQKIVAKISSAITEFQKEIIDVNTIEDSPIDSFADFDEYGKELTVLSGYNGFPKKYFKINNLETESHSLSDLKTLYQSISSTRLLIGNLCVDSIYLADIRGLLNDYNNKKFLIRRKTKKILISYMKVKKNPDVKTLTRILNTYISSVERLKQVLPEYQEIYGDSVTTMNGVVEIETNVKFIKQFNQISQSKPYFNLDNSFIKKCFKDNSFKQNAFDQYQSLEKKEGKIKALINSYIGFFLDDEKPYFTLPFEEVLTVIKRKSNGTYQQFNEYALFKEKAQSASVLLNLTIRKYQKEKKKLTTFADDYIDSLFLAFHERGEKIFHPFEDSYHEAEVKYFSGLFEFDKLDDRLHYDRTAKLLTSIRQTGVFFDDYQTTELKSKTKSLDYDNWTTLIGLYGYVYPITVLTKSEMGVFTKNSFDNVFVFNSSKLSQASLTTAINIGKRIMFVDSITESDSRTFGYHSYSLNHESLYNHFFHFESLTKVFVNLIKSEAAKHLFKVDTSDPVFPFMLVNSKGKRIAFLPDILIPEELKKDTVTTLRGFLMKNYGIPLLIIDTYEFMFAPSKTFVSAMKIYGAAKKKSKTEELSFYRAADLFPAKSTTDLYLEEIAKIKASFRTCLSHNEFYDLINHHQYEDAFYGVQPIRKSIADRITNQGFQKWLDYQVNSIGLIINKDGFYMDVSLEKIDFKKSDKSIRIMEEISEIELMQGIKAFVFSFDFFEEEELRSIMSALVGYDANDPEFSLHFDDVIEMMLNHRILKRLGGKLSLRLD